MASPHTARVEAVLSAALDSKGTTELRLRRAAAAGEGLSEPLAGYVRRVHGEPTAITDAEVQAIKAEGFDDDALFEITIAAALGAAHARLELALGAPDKEKA